MPNPHDIAAAEAHGWIPDDDREYPLTAEQFEQGRRYEDQFGNVALGTTTLDDRRGRVIRGVIIESDTDLLGEFVYDVCDESWRRKDMKQLNGSVKDVNWPELCNGPGWDSLVRSMSVVIGIAERHIEVCLRAGYAPVSIAQSETDLSVLREYRRNIECLTPRQRVLDIIKRAENDSTMQGVLSESDIAALRRLAEGVAV